MKLPPGQLRRRALAFIRGGVVVSTLAAAGCGGTSSPPSVLGAAVGRIGQIRAGDLFVRFTMAPSAQASNNTVGVTMQGSFALDRQLPLPILHVAYTQLAGAQTKSTRIDSNGHSATVLSAGRPVPLNPQQQQALASTLRGPQGLGALPLHIDNWVTHPRQGPGPILEGHPTQQVSGGVNLPQLLSDLGALTGGGVNRAAGADSSGRALQKTLRSSTFIADVGRNDHLLRRLYLRVMLAPPSRSTASQTSAGALTIVLNIAITPRPLGR